MNIPSGSAGGPTTTPPKSTTIAAGTRHRTLGGRIWTVSTFLLGTAFGWLTEDLIKKPFIDFVESELQARVPWDSWWVQKFWPNTIAFEGSEISGCSGGELRRLVTQAKTQGMNFPDEEHVADALLCQSWTYHGSARSVLEHMATKFDKCFSLDQTNSFDIRLNHDLVCKTDYALNPATNEWVKTPGATTLLCLGRPINTPMSQTEPVAHECPKSELKRLQFTK